MSESEVAGSRQTDDENVEKYRELYAHARQVLTAESERYGRLDEKASSYLAVLTLAFSVYGLIAAELIKGLSRVGSAIEWLLLVLVLVVPIPLVVAWLEVFRVLKIQNLRSPSLGDPLIRFFDDNSLVDIYCGFARRAALVLEQNRAVGNRKAACLQRAYVWVRVTVLAQVALLVLFGVRWVIVK